MNPLLALLLSWATLPAQPTPPPVFLTEHEQPTPISFRLPRLTPLALEARIDGIVILETHLTKRGTVAGTRVLKGLPLGLSSMARDAVEKWVFEPVVADGKEVPALIHLRVPFTEPPRFVRKGNQPRPTRLVVAEFPELARTARIRGDVVLRVVTDAGGRVIEAEVLKGLPLGLSDAALQAVRETRFQPVLDERARPVSVEFHHVVTFTP